MGSTFGTYNVAYSGMYVNQSGLATTTNNLANISTTGASRVRVASADLSTVMSDGTETSGGVSVASITRARNELLDATYREENADASYWSVKNGNLKYMQELLSEFTGTDTDDDGVADNGLQQMITDFFNDWEELSKDPSSQSNRQAVTEAGASLLSALSELDDQLQQLQQDAVNSVQDGVDTLNDYAQQVAKLNQQISEAEAGGKGEASYLRDQRDELLDEMSSLANISTSETDGVFQVMIGGMTLVSGNTTHTLVVDGDGSTTDPLTVKWADTDTEAEITSGSIKAYLEDADQTGYSTIDSSDIPYNFTAGATSSISNLRQALNDLVTTLATEINSLHSSGMGLDGSTGLDFFTTIDSTQLLSITNIQVNPDLVDNPDKVAASASGDDGDNTIAEKIYDLSSEDCFEFDGLSMDTTDFYQALISWIGTAGSNAESNYETQTDLVEQVDAQRQSVSSISIDEEMSNLIKYQNAYTASAKVLSTIDQLIGDLISDVG